ncbi:MAG TPA: hypothetical protein VGY54_00735, partial [Polyangiaceae bacterium]|nr:hypothetical protein [Polyangiaceae bacterium]
RSLRLCGRGSKAGKAPLKARAALEGKSLSDYLLAEIAESAERPTVSELRARLAGRSPVSPARKPALALREERNSR